MNDLPFKNKEHLDRPLHPRELADQTLQNLTEYSKTLGELSIKAGDLITDDHFYDFLIQLIEGIGTFTEGITHVKQVLKVTGLPKIQVLEADLLSILKDLLNSQERGQYDYMADLLKEHLPLNLKQWREEGIPTLIRATDS